MPRYTCWMSLYSSVRPALRLAQMGRFCAAGPAQQLHTVLSSLPAEGADERTLSRRYWPTCSAFHQDAAYTSAGPLAPGLPFEGAAGVRRNTCMSGSALHRALCIALTFQSVQGSCMSSSAGSHASKLSPGAAAVAERFGLHPGEGQQWCPQSPASLCIPAHCMGSLSCLSCSHV